jgi:hypothetical protein
VAGSRREYLAADKLKIYSTVKLSSAPDAYPVPALDDRPKFNVAIIYEDSAAGKRAKHFYDRMIRELVDECDFSLELWNFRVLAVSGDWKFSRESRRTGRHRDSLNAPHSSAFCPD